MALLAGAPARQAVIPSGSVRPPLAALALSLALLALAGCASLPARPAPGVAEAALGARAYSAELGVRLRGREWRGRGRVLVACARPDALRLEVPGPSGARLVAVARDGRLTAVFPPERAVYEGHASADELGDLLGLALEPGEVMDLLLGRGSPRLSRYELRWGPRAPARIAATLPDGALLDVSVKEPELDPALGEQAFAPPPHPGYRALSREEASRMWSRP